MVDYDVLFCFVSNNNNIILYTRLSHSSSNGKDEHMVAQQKQRSSWNNTTTYSSTKWCTKYNTYWCTIRYAIIVESFKSIYIVMFQHLHLLVLPKYPFMQSAVPAFEQQQRFWILNLKFKRNEKCSECGNYYLENDKLIEVNWF